MSDNKRNLFWAKIRGYPWWPAVLHNDDYKIGSGSSNNEARISDQIPVMFLGSHDYGIVKLNDLKSFEEFWPQFHNKGNSAKFKQAIKEAETIYGGVSTSAVRGQKSVRALRSRQSSLFVSENFIGYVIRKFRIIIRRKTMKV